MLRNAITRLARRALFPALLLSALPAGAVGQAAEPEPVNRAGLGLGFLWAHPDHQLCGPGYLTPGAQYQRGARSFARVGVQWHLPVATAVCDYAFVPDEQGRLVTRHGVSLPARAQGRLGIGRRLAVGAVPLHAAAVVAAIRTRDEWRPYGGVAAGIASPRSGAGLEVELGWDRVRHVTNIFAAPARPGEPQGPRVEHRVSHTWAPLLSASLRLHRAW